MPAIASNQPCPKCGARRGLTKYADGEYCFACQSTDQGVVVEPITREVRGIRPETFEFWGYGKTRHGDDWAHVAVWPEGQKLRFRDKSFRWIGKHAGLYGRWLWPAGRGTLVITEGELDALSVSQAQGLKWPVVSVPDGAGSGVKAVKHDLDWVDSFSRVVIMFDMDEAGQAAALEVAQLLRPGKAYIAKLPDKDANDTLRIRGEKALVDAIFQAHPYRPSGVVSWDEAMDMAANSAPPPTIPWPIESLQAATGGVPLGKVTVLTAGVSAGKSTLARELAVSAMGEGYKVGLFALEDTLAEAMLFLLGIKLSRNLFLEGRAVGEFREEAEWFSDRCVLFNPETETLDADNLESRIRYMAVAQDCRVVVVDHLTTIVAATDTRDERRTIDDLMRRLAGLATETGAAIVLVVHLKRTDGTAAEDGGKISMAHLRGSGMIAGLAYQIVAAERDQQGDDPTLVRYRVLKNRRSGVTGLAGAARWDREKGRLLEETIDFDVPAV